MTAHRDVILWIAIVFVIVSSVCSVHQKDKVGVCYYNDSVTVSANVSYVEMYEKFIGGKYCFYGCWETRSRIAYKTENKRIWVLTKECCPDYEYKNDICKPQCSPTCINGFCAQPNICACDYGWGGDACGEPVICYIALPDQFNHSKVPSEVLALKNLENVTDNSLGEWKRLPECPTNYLCQIQNENLNSHRSNNMTYYFVPINSSCNTVAVLSNPLKTYTSIIGTVMGIILSIMVVGTVCIVLRKRRSSKRKKNTPTELAYDDVNEEQIPDCEVIGRTLIDDYDYVNPESIRDCNIESTGPVLHCNFTNMKEIRDYNYVDARPIRIFDNVNPKPIRDYDDVNAGPIREYDNVDTERICDYNHMEVPEVQEYDYVGIRYIRW